MPGARTRPKGQAFKKEGDEERRSGGTQTGVYGIGKRQAERVYVKMRSGRQAYFSIGILIPFRLAQAIASG